MEMNITDTDKKSKESPSKTEVFPSKLLECRRLNKEGSSKEILHVVLDLTESDHSYQPGESVGIYPKNAPTRVDEILTAFDLSPETRVQDKRNLSVYDLRTFLSERANLSKITSNHLKAIQAHAPNVALAVLLSDKPKLQAFIENNNLLTCLHSFWQPNIPIQSLCDALLPLLPRFYSVASSQKKVGNRVELMVASFSYEEAGTMKHSVTASYLRDYCKVEETMIDIFFQRNPSFALPENTEIPIILIGPGTGLAALRAFLQEREMSESTGKNWLFTGDRERQFDFHYGDELELWHQSGFLKLDLAFSRDKDQKVYVQDRMLENSKELWNWIDNQNASIYICGDAKRMAKDVLHTLHQIAEQQGALSPDDAKVYYKNLRKSNRLLLDIY